MQCCSSFSASAENLSLPLRRKLMEPTQACRAPWEFSKIRPSEVSWNSGYSDLQSCPKIQHNQTCRDPRNSAKSDLQRSQKFSKIRLAELPRNSANSILQSSPEFSKIRPAELPQTSAHSDLQSSPEIQQNQTFRTLLEFSNLRLSELP